MLTPSTICIRCECDLEHLYMRHRQNLSKLSMPWQGRPSSQGHGTHHCRRWKMSTWESCKNTMIILTNQCYISNLTVTLPSTVENVSWLWNRKQKTLLWGTAWLSPKMESLRSSARKATRGQPIRSRPSHSNQRSALNCPGAKLACTCTPQQMVLLSKYHHSSIVSGSMDMTTPKPSKSQGRTSGERPCSVEEFSWNGSKECSCLKLMTDFFFSCDWFFFKTPYAFAQKTVETR